jgi:hypothetical protein
MNKKEYMTPDFKIVVLKSQNRLLVDSQKRMTVSLKNVGTPINSGDGEGEELDLD